MHEGAIAESIVDILKETKEAENIDNIVKVRLKIGIMSGVMVDALLFALTALKEEERIIKDTEFDVVETNVKAHCVLCNKDFYFKKGDDISLLCNKCGMPLDIIEGKEMEIIDIEAEQ